jgi:aryl-alcohol dehydrogenase-like predicted oxidoreductase
MDDVNLGRTGLKVSRICLGCMTYGRALEHNICSLGVSAHAISLSSNQRVGRPAL